MVLLKRLLVPGKGNVISCILILLNVLCGEHTVKTPTFSLVLVTLSFINFQFTYGLGELDQAPVYNKTDPSRAPITASTPDRLLPSQNTTSKYSLDSANSTVLRNGNASGRVKARRPKLLREITMLNRQNCLAKLLCGVQVAQPPTKASSAVNDYAYLVKAFFDRFSIRGLVSDAIDAAFAYETDTLDTSLDDEEDDLPVSKKKKKKRKSPSSYNPKYYEEYDKDLDDMDIDEIEEDDMPDFYDEHFRRRAGGKQIPQDIDLVRKKRGISGRVKRGFLGFYNPRFDKTAFINKRQLLLESSDSTARQLGIAGEIANRLGSSRQCRLLNWFGNNKDSSPGMTTTITTITNTGMNAANQQMTPGANGQQVVTVIQQSPNGVPTTVSTPVITTTSGTSMMDTANTVASSMASSICPFDITELQQLILKAQTAPFPHFLTTTTPKPTKAAPLTTSTFKAIPITTPVATKPPPPTAQVPQQSYVAPPSYMQVYGNLVPELRPTPFMPQNHPMMVPLVGHSRPRNTNRVHNAAKAPSAQNTASPMLVPKISYEDDEGDFEDDPYVLYERHRSNRRTTPQPKWMTTTTTEPDYLYDPAPSPSYSKSMDDSSVFERYFRSEPIVTDSNVYRPGSSFPDLVPMSGGAPTKKPTKKPKTPKPQSDEPASSESDSDEDPTGSEGDESSDSEEDLRSYEQNDYSKDRGGPPPQNNKGFFSNLLSSFTGRFFKPSVVVYPTDKPVDPLPDSNSFKVDTSGEEIVNENPSYLQPVKKHPLSFLNSVFGDKWTKKADPNRPADMNESNNFEANNFESPKPDDDSGEEQHQQTHVEPTQKRPFSFLNSVFGGGKTQEPPETNFKQMSDDSSESPSPTSEEDDESVESEESHEQSMLSDYIPEPID